MITTTTLRERADELLSKINAPCHRCREQRMSCIHCLAARHSRQKELSEMLPALLVEMEANRG